MKQEELSMLDGEEQGWTKMTWAVLFALVNLVLWVVIFLIGA